MTKRHLWNIIEFDDKRLTSASLRYARVVARWLRGLASYARQSNLMVITFGIVLI